METYYILDEDGRAVAYFETDEKLNVRNEIMYAAAIIDHELSPGDFLPVNYRWSKISQARRHADTVMRIPDAFVLFLNGVAYHNDYRKSERGNAQ